MWQCHLHLGWVSGKSLTDMPEVCFVGESKSIKRKQVEGEGSVAKALTEKSQRLAPEVRFSESTWSQAHYHGFTIPMLLYQSGTWRVEGEFSESSRTSMKNSKKTLFQTGQKVETKTQGWHPASTFIKITMHTNTRLGSLTYYVNSESVSNPVSKNKVEGTEEMTPVPHMPLVWLPVYEGEPLWGGST